MVEPRVFSKTEEDYLRDNKKIDHPEKIEPSSELLVVQLIGDDGPTKENVYEKLGAAVSEVTSAKDIDLSFTLFNKTIYSKLCLNVGKENEKDYKNATAVMEADPFAGFVCLGVNNIEEYARYAKKAQFKYLLVADSDVDKDEAADLAKKHGL